MWYKLVKSPWFNLNILALLFFAFSFAFRTDFSFDQDLGRHLKLGKIILESSQVPKTNLFSYTFPDFPFINHHYFFEISTFWIQQKFGMEALLILKLTIFLASLGLIFSLVAKSRYPLLLPIGFIFLHTMRERVDLRPEILSFFFTALTYFILHQMENGRKKLWIFLPLIQLLWTNTHIYFPIGLFLQAIFLTGFVRRKHFAQAKVLGLALIISATAVFLNPNGLSGALYPFKVFENYGYTIAENQNLFFLERLNFRDPNFLFVKLSALIALTSLLVGGWKKTLTLTNLLLTCFGVGLALIHVRSFPYLVLISLPSVVANFGGLGKKSWALGIQVVTVMFILIEAIFYLSGTYYLNLDKNNLPESAFKEQGKGGMNFVLQNQLPQPIFNNFDIGSYIIYRAYPEYKVFVDGRPEAYPKEFFQKIYIPMQEDPQIFEQVDKQFKFQTIIFSHTDQTPWAKSFLQNIARNPGWQTVYLDDFIIILTKSEAAKEKNLQAINLDTLTPQNYQFGSHLSFLRIALFLLNTNHPDPVLKFIQSSLYLYPQSPIGNSFMAAFLSQTDNFFQLRAASGYSQKSQKMIWW